MSISFVSNFLLLNKISGAMYKNVPQYSFSLLLNELKPKSINFNVEMSSSFSNIIFSGLMSL